MDNEQLLAKLNDLEQKFHDHKHIGTDSQKINTSNKNVNIFASDTVQASADTERTVTGSTWTKKKEVQVNVSGTIRVKWDAKGDPSSLSDYLCQVYINGVTAGTLHQTGSNAYVTYSDTSLSVENGDLVQLYTKCVAAGTSYVKNFKVCYTFGASPSVLLD